MLHHVLDGVSGGDNASILPPAFEGVEAPTALLGNFGSMVRELGQPRVSVAQMVAWVGAWLGADLKSLGKPTKFEARNGRF